MTVEATALPGVLVIEPARYQDDRGYFMEVWQQTRYGDAGVPTTFVQDNVSHSLQGVLRGLHYQWPHPQGKLLSVLRGRVYDVAVDIRQGAPTYGQWVGVELDAATGRQLYVPEGFAHGFVVLSAAALVHYKCTRPYAPECEHTIRWDDPALAIDWPVDTPILSDKDAAAPRLHDLDEAALPTRGGHPA